MFPLRRNNVAIFERVRDVAVRRVIFITVLAVILDTDGAIVNHEAIAVSEERLTEVGINVDGTGGVVNHRAAVERRHADQLIFIGLRNAFVSGQRDGALVNGGAAIERHHAKPGVINGNVAGIRGGGIAVTPISRTGDHACTGHIEFCRFPVRFIGNVAFIIQRRGETIEINIAGIER